MKTKIRFPAFPKRAPAGTQKHFTPNFLGEVADLRQAAPGTVNVILGDLVVMNTDEPPAVPQFVDQPTRENRRNDFSIAALFAAVRGQRTEIFTSIHPTFAEHLELKNGAKHILAVDAFCAYAARQKRIRTLLICSGYCTADQTYFDTYLFRHGQLMQITEAQLSAPDSSRFNSEVKEQIAHAVAEYDEAHIIWTPPLPTTMLDGFNVEVVGADIFKGRFPAVLASENTSKVSKTALVIPALTLVACGGWIALDASTMTNKRAEFDDLVAHQGRLLNMPIEELQVRASWQKNVDKKNTGSELSSAYALLQVIDHFPAVRIDQISIPTERGTEEIGKKQVGAKSQNPLNITLSFQAVDSLPPMEQVQPLISTLEANTGLSVYVPRQGGIVTTTQDKRVHVTVFVTPPQPATH